MTTILETQRAIKQINTVFENYLSDNLKLTWVSSPKFIKTNTGIQDDLANTCESVKFNVPSFNDEPTNSGNMEIIHSLAKWKRNALRKYDIKMHTGIYTNMDAIRKDEETDFMHSIYVDQWDWEMRIEKSDRTEIYLKNVVNRIYESIKHTYYNIQATYSLKINKLPDKITFIHSEELELLYPLLTPKKREDEITKKFGAVFLIGIGYPLKNSMPHDIRAFDYDDWSSENKQFHGLNGDILVWNNVTQCAFELSSMGIRVDSDALSKQFEISKTKQPKITIDTQYHKLILENSLPLSIGGGIGKSRFLMFLLEKRHIGEVQCSEWLEDTLCKCKHDGIRLL